MILILVDFIIYSANIEINKVRKQKEIDLAGLQAGLKKSQSRINSLEQEVQQKVCLSIFLSNFLHYMMFTALGQACSLRRYLSTSPGTEFCISAR